MLIFLRGERIQGLIPGADFKIEKCSVTWPYFLGLSGAVNMDVVPTMDATNSYVHLK